MFLSNAYQHMILRWWRRFIAQVDDFDGVLFSEMDGLFCTGQAMKHIWRNSSTSLLSEVCADDVIQKNDESSTTKPSSSEKKTSSKYLTTFVTHTQYRFFSTKTL
ncbi:unnamed protein product [Schistosoma spindalis]|nr:unnamed protein product [Schistosoma spindale]